MILWRQGVINISNDKVCTYCGKSYGILPYICSYCEKPYCIECRHPETHSCYNFNQKTAIPLWKKLNK